MSNMSLDKTIGEVWNDEYVVPLYQRNFAWTDTQIGQLLQDIWDHAPKTKEEVNQRGNYYLGNLVILLRRDGKYEVNRRTATIDSVTYDLPLSWLAESS